ncbi:MAG TPA: sigma-70 family RNA polymerase sigma factor [Egicoccus sp.]|nr:sigma-70 family RNA polymerase sigma factor [Egicoccus sp.]HSK24039.1 sigma-70 family RNA polymerase sigma factor [Egicoccus sp.]
MDPADELVVVRCQLGERDAFGPLIARWHRPVTTFVAGMVGAGPRAEDLVQDVWVRVLRSLPRLNDPAVFPAWLFTLARRVVLDDLRRTYRRPSIDDGADPDGPATGDSEADVARLLGRVDLDRALATLGADDREAVVLFHLLDLPIDDVAAIAGVPPGTVKSRLHRARRRLRDHLDDQGAPR